LMETRSSLNQQLARAVYQVERVAAEPASHP